MAAPGGRERTGAEYCASLAAAGFSAPRVIETGTMLDVVEARG